ncbi:hypothetical protein ABEO76_21805 [Bacillus anthracis]|uniref:hypothetical protein n=1 Tax=Bacillus anthracis TaxID=1392 RepID=UPI003D1AF286
MDSIQIITGEALKRWFEENERIESIRAHKGALKEYIVDLEDIDNDKYYHFYDTYSNYVIIEEAVIVKVSWDVDTSVR